MTQTNRSWIYAAPLTGKLGIENFALREEALPPLRQGQALIKNRMISLDPANRAYFSAQTYRPQLVVGDVMAGFGIGEVVESLDPRFAPGDLVHADLGWQDFTILNSYERSEYVYKCTPGYSDADLLGILGITGLTAYFGVREVGRLKAGDTVVVGGASGACGSIVGQLAKLAGCRVVGFAGGAEKAAWLVDELGFDAAVDYRGGDPARALAALCPDGIDFLSDAVGGVVTHSSLPLMKRGAGWYHYGNVSTYDSAATDHAPTIMDSLTPELLALCEEKQIAPVFFFVFDYYCERKAAEKALADAMAAGQLKAPTTIWDGLETLPRALVDGTLGGGKIGKLNVRLAG